MLLRARLVLSLFVFLTLLQGCSTSHPGVLRLPLGRLSAAPDPALGDTPDDLFVDSLLYSGLVKFGPDLHVIPELAVSIPTISDGGFTYTFTIRHDARFADGRRVRASDFVYSWTRALHIDSSAARMALGDINGAAAVERGAPTLIGVTVINRATLRIHLSHPDADFLERLSLPPAFVVDRARLGQAPMQGWPSRVAGTGPFRLSSRRRDGSIVLVPRRHFYGGHIALRAVTLVPTHGSELSLYRHGGLDAARLPMGDDSERTRSDFHQSNGLDAIYALPSPPDGSALGARLNRQSLTTDTLLMPLAGIVPPAVPDYVSTTAPAATPANPPITISTRSTLPVVALLRSNLTHQWRVRSHARVHVRLVTTSSILPDPASWLSCVPTTSGWYHHLLARSRGLTEDPVTRMSTYSRLESWALRKGLIVPLAATTVDYLIKPAVQGLQVTPLGLVPNNADWTSVSVT